MNLTEIKEWIPGCCTVAKIDISKCHKDEKESLEEFLPSVKSIIVLGHQIKDSREWIWTQMESERDDCTCVADLHTKNIIREIKDYIQEEGHNAKIIPYPGISGIRFKKLAEKTSLGEIGDNFLFLHNEWGPWIHLRVLLTDRELNSEDKNYEDEVCIHCGKCIAACPVDAIGQNNFDSQRCRERQEKSNVSHSCEICARICPLGEAPEKIKVNKVNE